MTFVTTSLLAGTAFVALPIVLHLIMRRKPKLLEFPALRFIRKRHDTNQRRLRLRHLLLLLLRAAAIALLACALARPSVHFSDVLGSQEAPVAAVLVFDAAPRMQYRHDNRTRLETARQLGLWLLAQLPRQSEIAVLDTRLGQPAFQVDRGAAKQRIERQEVVTNSQSLTDVVDDALQLVGQSNLANREIYVFTDLSRAAWPTETVASLHDRITDVPGVGIYLIDVGVREPVNCALGELRLSSQVLSNRSSLEVRTDLSCTGPADRRTVQLYLLDNQGNQQKRDEQACAPDEAGQAQQVSFRIGGLGVGTHQGEVRIVGQDGLAADDERFFTVEVLPAWRILIAAPEPTDRYDLYLTEALATTESRKRGDARFDCQTIPQDQLLAHSLQQYAAVCLVDPKPLEPAAWKKLGDFVSDGHGVAIFLGRNARPVDSFNTALAQKLLPGKLVRVARNTTGDLQLAPRQYDHPVLAEFRELAGAVPWHLSPVLRYWQLDEPAKGVDVVLSYSDRSPALLERSLGGGRVLTMTTPVSDDPNDERTWNLLPVSLEAGQQWPFFILVNEMTSYLVGSTDWRLNYFAGQTAVLQLDPQRQHDIYQVFPPAGPTFRRSADLTRHLLTVGSTDAVGNYRVRAGGEKGVDCGFSVNLAPGQTRLDAAAEEQLAEVFGPFGYRLARTQKEIQRHVSRGRTGRELFSMLILAVALVLAAEHLVANRFYPE